MTCARRDLTAQQLAPWARHDLYKLVRRLAALHLAHDGADVAEAVGLGEAEHRRAIHRQGHLLHVRVPACYVLERPGDRDAKLLLRSLSEENDSVSQRMTV